MGERLAARERHATARLVVVDKVLLDLPHHLVGRHLAAGDLDRLGQADVDTLATEVAAHPIDVDGRFVQRDRDRLADVDAVAAAIAAAVAEYQLGLERLTLRVVAEPAAQGTALEEYGGTYAGSVVDGELLDVEDGSGIQCALSGSNDHLGTPRPGVQGAPAASSACSSAAKSVSISERSRASTSTNSWPAIS